MPLVPKFRFSVFRKSAWNLSSVLRSSYWVLHVQKQVIILFQHHNCLIKWNVTKWQMTPQFTCEARSVQVTYVRYLWPIQWNWILLFLVLLFPQFYARFYGFRRCSVRGTLRIPWVNLCSSYSFPWFCIQIEYNLSYGCHFKYFFKF
jgi:hypothetical protein